MLQIKRAGSLSTGARLVKLADKICNLRDVAERPPAKWDLERRREYFEWAKQVIDGLRGASPALEAAFDAAYGLKPVA
jgi:guanosine-3',5'-bis(diphosphate) 3'-pyrophosphohydrolase